jgi:hypothetical protein
LFTYKGPPLAAVRAFVAAEALRAAALLGAAPPSVALTRLHASPGANYSPGTYTAESAQKNHTG